MANTRFTRSAENVTPHRIGGRVTATNSGSATRPEPLTATMTRPPQTPNMPRIQVTIWGAPNTTAIPTIAAIGHPQEIRLAMAIIPSAITKMTAMGVAHARMLVCSELAPVKKGDVCANASSGATLNTNARTPKIEPVRSLVPSAFIVCTPIR